MKKLIAAFAFCLCLLPVCAAQDARLSSQAAAQWADGMAQALVDNFWGASFEERPDRYFFNKASQQSDMGTGDYWPQAHAIDVITDAYLRT